MAVNSPANTSAYVMLVTFAGISDTGSLLDFEIELVGSSICCV